ncbi:MAG: hypothetical protein IKA30_01090 [Alphaproteobacteria bacterium]|nr:hypothetical protein [Alphaproteobacteria bacterium]
MQNNIIAISKILDNHSIPYYIKGDRIYADSMQAFTKLFENVVDLTDYTKSELYDWLGY